MGALISMANKVRSNLQNNSNDELIVLLKQKIEDSIMENRKIVVDVSTPLISCRDTFSVEDYEVNDGYLYLNHRNFDLHINLDKIEIKYDDTVYENFIFVHNDADIILQFLG